MHMPALYRLLVLILLLVGCDNQRPKSHADAIPAATATTPLDPVTYKFKCCGGATGITDLDVVYSLDVSGDKNFTFTLSMLSPPCTPVVDGASATLLCKGGIKEGEVILETVPTGATIVSPCYSVPLKSCLPTTGTLVPEPATCGLMLLGFGMLTLMRNAQRSRRAT